MTDPDRGASPQEEGTAAKSRGKAKAFRREKSKRNGGHSSAASAGPIDQGASDGAVVRPAHAEPGPGARKRKRRRRGRATGRAASASAAAQPRPGAQQSHGADHHHGEPSGSSHKSGKKNRRHRNRRGPQGRALVAGGQAEKAPVMDERHQPARAPEPVAPERGRHVEHRSSAHAPRSREADADQDLYAALDLGTNNCRLLIAAPTRPGQFRVVDAFSRIVRLGEGLAASGRLSPEAMDRAVDALRICAGKLKGREIRRMRLIATEACRAADNGEEFLRRVVGETGLDLEIINRETEARLAVSGCSSLVGREARSVVLFDIGGGSSEIAVIRIGENRSSRLANHITHWTSLPVGVVTLSERHGGRDVTPDMFEAMTREVTGMLERFDCPPIAAAALGGAEDFHLIGTSGTVTTLAGVHLDLPRYDRRKVDGLWLTDEEVTAMQARLLSWDYGSRAANPCIGPDRADLVLAGCAILEAIRRRWPARRMRVADRGLREGLLTDMMADDGVWRRNRGRRPFRERER
ncbi:Ppx/GppA phosphatase family protein [Rhizobium sp. RU36D]|uniref:Ppx/GppA phosphatase family protein n=1 Tax=Rhizobium sp. RU36D TaxID=1907415 RepID=UPI0009FC89C3|nr:Ppx/GppA phosphatase family protein [Rhizobium sp. RU36D]